jgi:hypothetical protein
METVLSPAWMTKDAYNVFTAHASQEDAMRWMSPGVGPVCLDGHVDDPSGAVFTTLSGACRLYRRHVQPSGAAYCAKAVEQVAADDVLPVVGVPELVASYL